MMGYKEVPLSMLPGHLTCFDATAEVGVQEGEYTDNRLLHIEIIDRSTSNKEHYGLKFNVDWADDERIKWLADILARNLAQNIWRAKKNQRQNIQSAAYKFGAAIGINLHKIII